MTPVPAIGSTPCASSTIARRGGTTSMQQGRLGRWLTGRRIFHPLVIEPFTGHT